MGQRRSIPLHGVVYQPSSRPLMHQLPQLRAHNGHLPEPTHSPSWATASLPTTNANQLESTPTASRAHAHQTGPRTMRPLQRSRRASLCLQPLQVLPYLQIMRWRSSCVLEPSPLQKKPAKPQLATTKVYEAVSQLSNNS